MELTRTQCYRVLETRDRRFDGRLFFGVTTTGIYCRPICPARTPRPENVRYFPHAAAAECEGFRPCRRCRPESAPDSPGWLGASWIVQRALEMIGEGALDSKSVDALADDLGVGRRHLSRLFAREVGASPRAVARTRRLHFARALIDQTELRMIDVALGAGFSSVRRFNDAIRGAFGASPRELRARALTATTTPSFRLKLPYREPFEFDGLLDFLRRRAIPGVESVDHAEYRRIFESPDGPGELRVTNDASARCCVVELTRVDPRSIRDLQRRVRSLFDLDADPREIVACLGEDAALRTLVRNSPGLRVPGAWCGFEIAVRVILGQQVSVEAATTLAGRLVATEGRRIDAASRTLHTLFPTPARLAEADLTTIGIPRTRARALRELSRAVAEGGLDLERGDPWDVRRRLLELPGVGPWTAEMVAMRALRD
ncbi:MAG: DNA-3-methyladenine glycosylase 2 family protein, partial [Planctomycetes bacterium]|nr:DNA-3-methyladenine glycosylase 2 family protein [Planctomycetota bacterium]